MAAYRAAAVLFSPVRLADLPDISLGISRNIPYGYYVDERDAACSD